MEPPTPFQTPAWLFILLMILCFYVLVRLLRSLFDYFRVKRKGISAKGVIVDYKVTTDSEGMTYYPAVIEYHTMHGQIIQATATTSTGVKPKIGRNIGVIYDPANPSIFYFQKSQAPVLLLVVIIAFLAILVLLTMELFKTI